MYSSFRTEGVQLLMARPPWWLAFGRGGHSKGDHLPWLLYQTRSVHSCHGSQLRAGLIPTTDSYTLCTRSRRTRTNPRPRHARLSPQHACTRQPNLLPRDLERSSVSNLALRPKSQRAHRERSGCHSLAGLSGWIWHVYEVYLSYRGEVGSQASLGRVFDTSATSMACLAGWLHISVRWNQDASLATPSDWFVCP